MTKKDIQQIEIYKSKGGPQIDVRLQDETVWLNQYQMEELFETNRTSVLRHIGNIYKTNELSAKATCAKIAQVQKEGGRKVTRQINYYNLDVIIAVGYRVNSKRGTQFRIWATNVLKQHLVKGYTVNEKRLSELQQTIKLLHRATESTELSSDEAKGLLAVLSDYSQALDILDDYDHQRLKTSDANTNVTYTITYNDASKAIEQLKQKFGGSSLFGKKKDDSFQSSIATINQTFDGNELYTSIEEKAAHLLYFVTKNHSFVDGNKRN